VKPKPYPDLLTVLQPVLNHRFFPYVTALAVIASLFHFVIHGIIDPINFPGVDFQVYYNWITHQNPPPTPDTFQAPFVAIPYSPLWGIFLAPFALFSFPVAKLIWLAMNLLIVVWFIYQSIRWIKQSNLLTEKNYLIIAIPIIFFLNYMPIVQNLRVGQANLLALLFMTLSFIFYKDGKKNLCGLMLAFAVLTKITPAFLILYWLIKKEYRVFLSTLISIAILWVITIPLLGIQLQLDYFHYYLRYPVYFLKDAMIMINNISLYAWLTDYAKGTPPFHLLPIILFILFLCVTLFIWFRRITYTQMPGNKSTVLEYGWTVAFIPLLTHYTEDLHLVNFCIFYAGIWLYIRHSLPLWLWLSLILSWLLINGTFPFTDLLYSTMIPISLRYYNLYGALLAWITGYVMLTRIDNHEG
jgi:hypothetical protein